jgi:hypothetical protein
MFKPFLIIGYPPRLTKISFKKLDQIRLFISEFQIKIPQAKLPISTEFKIDMKDSWLKMPPENCLGADVCDASLAKNRKEQYYDGRAVEYVTLEKVLTALDAISKSNQIDDILKRKMPNSLRLILLQAMTSNPVNVLMGVSGSGKTYTSLQLANYYDVLYFNIESASETDLKYFRGLLAEKEDYEQWDIEKRLSWCKYYAAMFENMICARMIALYYFKSLGNTSLELAYAQHDGVSQLVAFSKEIFRSFEKFKVDVQYLRKTLKLEVKLILDEFQACYNLMPNAFISTTDDCTEKDDPGRCESPDGTHKRSLMKPIILGARDSEIQFYLLGTGISLNNVLDYTESAAGEGRKSNEDATYVISDFDFITKQNFIDFFNLYQFSVDFGNERIQSMLEMMSGRAR